MTIKSVIDQFIQAKIWYSMEFPIMKTESDQCPLQLATGREIGYVKASRELGLEDPEIKAFIKWADWGEWPINLFGSNPMEGAKQ